MLFKLDLIKGKFALNFHCYFFFILFFQFYVFNDILFSFLFFFASNDFFFIPLDANIH